MSLSSVLKQNMLETLSAAQSMLDAADNETVGEPPVYVFNKNNKGSDNAHKACAPDMSSRLLF